jgi:hypothetical protein
MAVATVPPVERLRIRPAQPLHAAREVRQARFHQHVQVCCHLAEDERLPLVLREGLCVERDPEDPVGYATEHGAVVDAARRDVVDAGSLVALGAGHAVEGRAATAGVVTAGLDWHTIGAKDMARGLTPVSRG